MKYCSETFEIHLKSMVHDKQDIQAYNENDAAVTHKFFCLLVITCTNAYIIGLPLFYGNFNVMLCYYPSTHSYVVYILYIKRRL